MDAATATSLNHLSSQIIGAAIEVHRTLGPGLLESIYETCLCRELSLRGIGYSTQVAIPIVYKGEPIDSQGLRLDLLVQNEIIVEIKAIESLLPVHEAQLLSYLRLCEKRLGLLLNFNVPIMKDGIKRIVNHL